ncbi:MAG: hypothetical protein H7A33_06760 [Deltaproteobacteria bacterium]|nr:hypothetical protein [Deltaproteobacteria bacterium]
MLWNQPMLIKSKAAGDEGFNKLPLRLAGVLYKKNNKLLLVATQMRALMPGAQQDSAETKRRAISLMRVRRV